MRRHELEAFNTATESENRIHDDEVARKFGFAGGLVPGVDVYAYLTIPAAERWGADWVERGTMTGRFQQPVYDGQRITVVGEDGDGAIEIRVENPAGEVCATGRATLPDAPLPAPDVGAFPEWPLPDPKPRASREAFENAPTLGSLDATFVADKTLGYLADIRDPLAVYRDQRIAHPAWLLRWANWILAANVALGPWIHVASDIRHHALVHDGADVSVRGRVAELFERKGHRFVELDVLWVADGGPVASGRHTAIYEPRQVS
jgi:acyl dehydratase